MNDKFVAAHSEVRLGHKREHKPAKQFVNQVTNADNSLIAPKPLTCFDTVRPLSSALLLGGVYLGSKSLMLNANHVSPFEVLYVRALFSATISSIYLKSRQKHVFSISAHSASLLMASVVLKCAYLAAFYVSLHCLSLAEACAFDALSAFLTMLLTCLILEHRFRCFQLLGCLCALGATVCLLRPAYLLDTSLQSSALELRSRFVRGLLAGLTGLLMSSGYNVTHAVLGKNVDFDIISAYGEFGTCIFLPCCSFVYNEIHGGMSEYRVFDLIVLSFLGVFAWCANYASSLFRSASHVVRERMSEEANLLLNTCVGDVSDQ